MKPPVLRSHIKLIIKQKNQYSRMTSFLLCGSTHGGKNGYEQWLYLKSEAEPAVQPHLNR